MLLGHPIDLKAKAGGEKSMSEKRETLEDAEGAVLQDPRDRAKAELWDRSPIRQRFRSFEWQRCGFLFPPRR